jgi:hypothetical protein
MSTPPECQPIADALANLVAQEAAQIVTVQGLSGVDKWRGLETLGALRQQIAEQQTLLDQCVKLHADDLTAAIVVTDLSGGSGPNRLARSWRLTSTGQAVKQTTTVQAGAANLAGILGSDRQSFGITIEQADHPTANGPDFRSGPLPGAGDGQHPDPVGRIEIVILDPMTVTADSLGQAAPPLPIHLSVPAGPIGTLNLAVTALQVTVENGEISLSASGTATFAGTTSTFTFANRFHLVPTFSMDPSALVEVLSGVPPTFTMSGLVGSIVQTVSPLVASTLMDSAVRPVSALLSEMIASRTATSLGLPALPSGSVLSICGLTVDGGTLKVIPALGAFGTVLSDFQPSPRAPAVRLLTLDLTPTSIGTSESASNVAQGTARLDGPAPPGGVVVQLSCDRTDLLEIVPVSLSIAEGATLAGFTVTARVKSLMPTTPIDAKVSASLGNQTLSAPLSVRPEPPATIVQQAPLEAASASGQTGGLGAPVVGIYQLGVNGPTPLSRGGFYTGYVTIDSMTNVPPQVVTITFDPNVIPPQGCTISSDNMTGLFGFTLSPNFPGDTLRITAVSSAGLKKYIDVSVQS